ncbi:hypothetical protein RCL1_000828 [Eukaryota sp. TZLM3-RCL]
MDPSTTCEVCLDASSSIYCRNCNMSFCSSCADKVHPARVYKKHRTLSVEDAVLRKLLPCPDHLSASLPEMSYFCDRCSTPICLDCINIGKHSDHKQNVVSINDRGAEFADSIDAIVGELQAAKQHLVQKKKFEQLKQQQCELLNSLDQQFDGLVEKARVAKKEALQRIQHRQFHAFEEVDVTNFTKLLTTLQGNFKEISDSLNGSIISLKQVSSKQRSLMIKSVASPAITTPIPDSEVLKNCANEFNTLFPQIMSMNPRLLFRASRDGFTATAFHQKCDNQSNVLVVFKTKNGNIAGGFSPTAFSSNNSYQNSPGAFLFRVKHPSYSSPQKFHLKTTGNDIYCHSSYGPTFGGGNDVRIVNNCNSSNCNSNIGSSYEGSYGEFVGQSSFQIEDYEVYQLTPSRLNNNDFEGSSVIDSSLPNLSSLGLNVVTKPELLFRASRDGFSASNFHQKCDNKGQFMLLFRTNRGNVAGAFSPAAFTSSGNYQQSLGAFLFRVKTSSANSVARYNLRGSDTNHIYCYSSYGPTFGSNHDLHLSNGCNSGSSSYCNTGNTYNGSYSDMLAENSFTVSDYEIWRIV